METLKKQTNNTLKKQKILVETLKKRTNIGGDVKETDKYSWRRERNRQIFGGDVKETDKYSWRR